MRYSGIYKIISPTGKIYIGKSGDLYKRKQDYEKVYKVRGQVRIYKSLIKYGWDSHIWEIVELCCIDKLNTKERYWQDFYNVLNKTKGLNCQLTETDNKSGTLSKNSRNKISKANTGKIRSIETKEKIRQINLGKKLSVEHKEKIRIAMIGRTFSKEWKNKIAKAHCISIIQEDLKKNFIKEWESATIASKELGISRKGINDCCRNKLKTSGNFIWRYKNINLK